MTSSKCCGGTMYSGNNLSISNMFLKIYLFCAHALEMKIFTFALDSAYYIFLLYVCTFYLVTFTNN